MTQTELHDKLSTLCNELGGGTYETYTTYNQTGRSSRKIVIEYDVKEKGQ
tara:strand:- start:1138 stop:1287 length:150 start_codon:yes stop_codon:yes gene_type:complete